MEKNLLNLIIFIAICFIVYIIFRNFNYKEGMTTTDASGNTTSSSSNVSVPIGAGAAGNASSYAANIKSTVIQLQDALLMSKYKTDYENVVLDLDDLVNNLMLNTALSINSTNTQQVLEQLNALNGTKTALNSVMKFIDSQ
jgi:hypothetical protein